MEAILFPSLSEDGWVTSAAKTADYMLSHFFLSDRSQSYEYDQYISSMPWILASNHGNIPQTIMETQNTLGDYFKRYFSNPVVEVNEIPNLISPSKAQIGIYIKFTDSQGNDIIVGKMITVNDTIIEQIVNINNG